MVDGPEGYALLPKGRYAKMRNTWFIRSCLTLERWVERCGYRGINLVDVSPTMSDEQRSTDWMRFDSLKTFLDPQLKRIMGLPKFKESSLWILTHKDLIRSKRILLTTDFFYQELKHSIVAMGDHS